jgi:hypothetical protein
MLPGLDGVDLGDDRRDGRGLLDLGVVAARRLAVCLEDSQLATELVVAPVEQVARVGVPGDRRLVRLTERGRSLEKVIAEETDVLTERALATLGPAEREAVIRALGTIRKNLTAG